MQRLSADDTGRIIYEGLCVCVCGGGGGGLVFTIH